MLKGQADANTNSIRLSTLFFSVLFAVILLVIVCAAVAIVPAFAILGGGSGIMSPLPYDLTTIIPSLSFNATYYNTSSSSSGLATSNNETSRYSNSALNLTFNAYDPKTNSSYHDVTYFITITKQETADGEIKNTNSTVLLSDYFFSRPGPLTFIIQQPTSAEQAIVQKYVRLGQRWTDVAAPYGKAFSEQGLLIYNVTSPENSPFAAIWSKTPYVVGPIHIKSSALLELGTYHVHVEIVAMGAPQALFDTPKIPKFDRSWSSDPHTSSKAPEFPFAHFVMAISFASIVLLLWTRRKLFTQY